MAEYRLRKYGKDREYHKILALAVIWGSLTITLVGVGWKWDVITYAVLYAVSFCSAMGFKKNISVVLEEKGKIRRVCLILWFLGVAFSVVGNYLFVYPINNPITLKKICLFFVALVWIVPDAAMLLSKLMGMCSKDGKDKISSKKIFLLGMAIMMLPVIFYLIAYNPCIGSSDTVYTMLNAHVIGKQPLDDWTSPLYILITKFALIIWDSPYCMVLMQFLFFSLVFADGICYLYERGLPFKTSIGLFLLVGFNPANILQLITIWKDIPYGTALLWMCVLLYKFLTKPEYFAKKWWFYIAIVLDLTLIVLVRLNGIVPFVFAIIALVIAGRKNKKIYLSVLATIGLVMLIQGPLYSSLGIYHWTTGGKYLGLSQDILGAYYAGGTVTEDTEEMIEELTFNEKDSYAYYPYNMGNLSFEMDMPMSGFIRNYLSTFIQNPRLVLNSALCRMDVLYNIFPGKDSYGKLVNYVESCDYSDEWKAIYPARTENVLTKLLNEKGEFEIKISLIEMLAWRIGFYLWIVLGIVWIVMGRDKKEKRKLLSLAPWLGQIISLLLSTGWADYRYYWPVYVMSVYLIATFISDTGTIKVKGE